MIASVTPDGGRVTADVAVVGLGALGGATAWQLARRGLRVVGLERFELRHVRGASHGDSRIIRLSYHTPGYVRAAREAYDDWALLEHEASTALVVRTGGIDVFPAGAAIAEVDYTRSMAACGVPFERLDAAESNRRWPGFAVPDGASVLFQAETGIVPASAGTAVLQQRARAHGARLFERCPVTGLRDTGSSVEITCGAGQIVSAGAVVVTADAWTNDLLAGLAASLPLTVTKEHAVHFAVPDPDGENGGVGGVDGRGGAHAPGAFPVWIWMDDPSWYGFPSFGEASVKVGQDCGGDPVHPDRRSFDPDPAHLARMQAFVRSRIPAAGPPVRVTTCLYTLTPDRDFVASVLPGHERVVVGLGAAHGFKFAPWFGRVLADLATDGRTASDVSAFGLDRPALTDPAAPARWLV